jgi:hypothetical protein
MSCSLVVTEKKTSFIQQFLNMEVTYAKRVQDKTAVHKSQNMGMNSIFVQGGAPSVYKPIKLQ